jgi:hypothetical protein
VVARSPNPTKTNQDQTPRGPNDSTQAISRYIAQPAPLGVYARAAVGPSLEVNLEPNVTQPVEGSNKQLRTLSPFVIRLEPPLAYASNPSLLDQQRAVAPPGVYDSAMSSSARSGFVSSRDYLRNTDLATRNLTSLNPEAYVSRSTGEQYVRRGDDTVGEAGSGSGTATQGVPNIADLKVAADIATQLTTTMRMPPLVLLINPQSLSISYAKVQQYSDRSRNGYIFHQWGEEQVKLSMTMSVGAFLSGGRGVQFASKRDSAAWQNFQAVYTFYRNNGYIFDRVGGSYANHFVGALSIHYDQWTYFGHFESLSYTHDEGNSQGGVSFSMEFVASAMVDNSESVIAADGLGAVQPLRSPMPNAALARFRRTSNRALDASSTIVIGADRQPRANVVTPGAEANPTTPTMIAPTSPKTLPRSTRGFQSSSSAIVTPAVQAPSSPDPFGL